MTDEKMTIYPVIGWDALTMEHGEAVLALHYLPGVPPLGTTTEQIHAAALIQRYGMTAEQCDELAGLLTRLAAKSRERRGASN